MTSELKAMLNDAWKKRHVNPDLFSYLAISKSGEVYLFLTQPKLAMGGWQSKPGTPRVFIGELSDAPADWDTHLYKMEKGNKLTKISKFASNKEKVVVRNT